MFLNLKSKANSWKILTIFVAAFLIANCAKSKNQVPTEPKPVTKNISINVSGEHNFNNSEPIEYSFPFEFPTIGLNAAPEQTILVPNINWIQEASAGDPDRVTMIWDAQTLDEAGKPNSLVKYTGGIESVPNPYIIPIPKGATANTGDIVLTWWQTGSGMQRAIVTDGTNSSEPKVRYLDIAFDNPTIDPDSGKAVSQTDYDLARDSFFPIRADFSPGSYVSFGEDSRVGQVIRREGEKLFLRLFAGKIAIVNRIDAHPVPIKPNVKKGDAVKAPFTGNFFAAHVLQVDTKNGRVWVKFDKSNQEVAVSFGEIYKE